MKYLLAILCVWFMLTPVSGAVFDIPAGDVAALINALETANSNGESDTINLADNSTYTLNVVHNSSGIDVQGLPVISTAITITGNGSRIVCGSGAPQMRFFYVNGSGTLRLSRLTLSGANSYNGSSAINNSGTVHLSGCRLVDNLAGGNYGGAICNRGYMNIRSSEISRNRATSDTGGAGIFSIGTLIITGSKIRDNYTRDIGGGIDLEGGTLSITNSTISGNDPGGIAIYENSGASQTIRSCTISNNKRDGGLMIYFANVSVISSTISGNQNGGSGGGIENNGRLSVVDSTIASNQAAGSGGGIYTDGGMGTTQIKNTIIANNSAASGPDCSGSINSRDYNLIGNSAGCSITGTTSHNIYDVNPRFGKLRNNSGSTYTHALLDDSPAIDQGSSNEGKDQRNFSRLSDIPDIPNAHNGVDIGSYEAVFSDVGVTKVVVGGEEVVASSESEMINRVRTGFKKQTDDSTTFLITATCYGPQEATGLVVKDKLPEGIEFVSASASKGHYNDRTGNWQVDSLAVEESATLEITCRLLTGKIVVNTVHRSQCNETDPNEDNDTASASVGGFVVTATVSGGNGKVSPTTKMAKKGESVKLHLAPEPYCHVESIVDNGVSVSITNPYIITNIQKNHHVVVTFARNLPTLELSGAIKTEKSWLISRLFGELRIKITEFAVEPVPVRAYELVRLQDGEWKQLTSFKDAGEFVYFDKFLEKNKEYTYKLRAITPEGNVLIETETITLL